MKKKLLIIILLFSNLSLANDDCNFFNLSKNQQKELYENIKKKVNGEFNEFFDSKMIKFKKKQFDIGINEEYNPKTPGEKETRVDIFFSGETFGGELFSTRSSIQRVPWSFYEGLTYLIYQTYYFPNDHEKPLAATCKILIGRTFIRIFDLKKPTTWIGEVELKLESVGLFNLNSKLQ